MPRLINEKHERFAAVVAITSERGNDLAKAYAGAGYKIKSQLVARSCGARLLQNATIRSRIAELRGKVPGAAEEKIVEILKKTQFDRARVLDRLDELSRKAEARGQLSAAIRSEELIGKESGMFIDRTQIVGYDDPEKWPDEVLDAKIAAAKAKLEREKAGAQPGALTSHEVN
jgi:hypothetical protein